MPYHKQFVNANQSKETRRWKYYNLRINGFPFDVSRRARDWTTKHVIQFIMTVSPNDYKE